MSDILRQKGNEAFQQGEYKEADRLYNSSITLEPSNAVLYSNRAMALIKLENWEDCESVCADGLEQNPDTKTKVKLLWRRGTALTRLEKFNAAQAAYNEALKVDPKNPSVLKSIDDLKSRESQYKRSHSIDEHTQGKRPKTLLLKREKIPIFEVDELPKEFQPTAISRKPESVQLKPNTDSKKQTVQELQAPVFESLETPSYPVLETPSYPVSPSVYQLSTIIKTNDNTKPHAFRYIFNIQADTYKKLFSGGNIDGQYLNFFLESILFNLKEDKDPQVPHRARTLLETLADLPRFNLVKLFVNQRIKEEIQAVLGENDPSLAAWH